MRRLTNTNTTMDNNSIQQMSIEFDTVQRKSIAEMIQHILVEIDDNGIVAAMPNISADIKSLSRRLGVSDMQAILFSWFVGNFDSPTIYVRDFVEFAKLDNTNTMIYYYDILALVRRGLLSRRVGEYTTSYSVPNRVLRCVCNNIVPAVPQMQS